MYVPSGKGGYFNIHLLAIPSVVGSFAAQVNLHAGGTIDGEAAGSAIVGTYPQDAWFDVAMAFDLGNSSAAFQTVCWPSALVQQYLHRSIKQ